MCESKRLLKKSYTTSQVCVKDDLMGWGMKDYQKHKVLGGYGEIVWFLIKKLYCFPQYPPEMLSLPRRDGLQQRAVVAHTTFVVFQLSSRCQNCCPDFRELLGCWQGVYLHKSGINLPLVLNRNEAYAFDMHWVFPRCLGIRATVGFIPGYF